MTNRLEGQVGQVQKLPKLPNLIFLDTNIVQNLYSFGEFICDNFLSPEMEEKLLALGPRMTEDVCALATFMAIGRHAGWPMAVSPRILTELNAIPEPNKRYHLSRWGMELADYLVSNFYESKSVTDELSYSEVNHFTFIQRCYLSELLKDLPQDADRQLVIDSLELDCDVFLTVDYRTVWRYRDKIKPLGLQVMRPVELVDSVLRWAG